MIKSIETMYHYNGKYTAMVQRGEVQRYYNLTMSSLNRISLDLFKQALFISEIDKGINYRYVFAV
jgi:hypothetical protein